MLTKAVRYGAGEVGKVMTIDDDSGKEGLDKMKITDEGVWEGRGVETIHIG